MGVIVTTCPNTGREISTGVEADDAAFARLTETIVRISCPHCGQQHNWSRHNAYLRESVRREWPTRPPDDGGSG